jgi:carbonic anhydrase
MAAEPKRAPTSEASAVSSNFSRDLLASLVVFLVAVPLALGIALASNAPILSGLIGCVAGGIVAGLFGGAPLQVTGPAAGLTVIVAGLVQQFGWPVVCAITALAGVVQILFGSLKIARICLAITPAVVHGMLAGIGVTIALAQIHILLGGAPESSAWKNLKALPGQILDVHTHAAILGLLTIAILFLWQYVPKRLKMLPGALVAVLVSTLISNLVWFDVTRVKLPTNLFEYTLPQLPKDWGAFIGAALTVAMVASVESLLCAVATDKLHSGPRANLDKELIGQGATNIVSGMLGGLPVTGVIVRSAANINAGARTRLSAILHGVWVLVFVLLLGAQLERIPLATLAGLLVYVGLRLVNPDHIRELLHHNEFWVYLVTLLSVTFWNLLAGVGVGIALAVILLLRKLSHTHIVVEQRADRWHVRMDGTLTFFSVPQMTAALNEIPQGAGVDIDLLVDYMDHAAFDALHGWRVTHEKLGGQVDIDEMHEDWYESAVSGAPRTRKSGVRIVSERT